jgi:hypothetical protein
MTTPPESLLAEKSLWDIYWLGVRKLPRSKFNYFVVITTLIIVGLFTCFSAETSAQIAEKTRALAETTIGFGSQILGFLVGGFAIFATLNKPEFFLLMLENRHEESGLSYLKFNFFSFVNVFIVYFVLLLFCFGIKILCTPNGILVSLMRAASDYLQIDTGSLKLNLARLGFTLLCGGVIYSLVALKTFIFNIYHVVATAIEWEKKMASVASEQQSDQLRKPSDADQLALKQPETKSIVIPSADRKNKATKGKRAKD